MDDSADVHGAWAPQPKFHVGDEVLWVEFAHRGYDPGRATYLVRRNDEVDQDGNVCYCVKPVDAETDRRDLQHAPEHRLVKIKYPCGMRVRWLKSHRVRSSEPGVWVVIAHVLDGWKVFYTIQNVSRDMGDCGQTVSGLMESQLRGWDAKRFDRYTTNSRYLT